MKAGDLAGKEQAYDVLTERTVQRPIFTEPKTWEKSVTVDANGSSTVTFVIRQQVALRHAKDREGHDFSRAA